MNEIDYDKHIKLKPGDKIYFIKYYDHAQSRESIEEVRKKPFVLWTIGKIVNEHTDDPFYALINTGSVFRFKNPNWRDYIMRSDIISKEVIYTVPDDFENIKFD